MISLKAIFISRRKINLALLMFLFLLLPLKAGDFRVAVVSGNDALKGIYLDVLELLSGSVDSEIGKALYIERMERSSSDSYEAEKAKLLAGENISKLESLKVPSYTSGGLVLSVVEPSFSEKELEYLFKGDEEAHRFLSERENLDLLIVLSEVSRDPVPTLELYVNGNKARDMLYWENLREQETEEAINLLFPYLKDSTTHLLKIALPENSTLYIDDQQMPLYTGYAALKEGKHKLSYTSMGYLPKTVDIVVGEGFSTIDLALDKVVPLPIYYRTLPYNADVLYNGVGVSGNVIEDGIYPFTVTASASGFDVYSMQSTKREETLDITLKPEWIADLEILKEAKNDFYKSLFITLMTFGAQIGFETVSGLYPEYKMGAISVVFSGASLVSLVNMLDSAFEYFQAAKLGL